MLFYSFATFVRYYYGVVSSVRGYLTIYRGTTIFGVVVRASMVRVCNSTNYRAIVYRARLYVARAEYPFVSARSVLRRSVVGKSYSVMSRLFVQGAEYSSPRVCPALNDRARHVTRFVYSSRVQYRGPTMFFHFVRRASVRLFTCLFVIREAIHVELSGTYLLYLVVYLGRGSNGVAIVFVLVASDVPRLRRYCY